MNKINVSTPKVYNSVGLNNPQPNDESDKVCFGRENDGVKRHVGLNVLFGTLAAVGTYALADILIFKGKGICKLTKNAKYIPKFFDASKFDRAAYDARLDRSVSEDILRAAQHETNPLRTTIDGYRKLSFENGKLASILHYDPETNVSKLEEFALSDLQEVITHKGGNETLGKVFKKGEIISEQYYFGDRRGNTALPFLYYGQSVKPGEGDVIGVGLRSVSNVAK